MKKPNIEVLNEGFSDQQVCIGGKSNEEIAEAYEEMIDALCMVWEELESKEDWGEDLSPSQINQIQEALLKAGVEI